MIMRKINYKLALFCLTVLAVLLFTPLFTHNVKAKDLDLIHEYNITCDVLDDATVKIKYHIVWEVLDSTKEGPLTWVKVGIPNAHVSNLKGKSDSIKKISQYSSGGDYVRIDLDRSYKAGETVTIDFELVQDHLYLMNKNTDGETVYDFTPGWFDDIEVESLTIKWNYDKADSFSPSCLIESDGYLT